MVHLIESSTLNDLDHIFSLYDEAMRFQRAKKTVVVWPKFATSLVLQEINEKRYQSLFEKEIVSEQEYEQKELAYLQAERAMKSLGYKSPN